MSNLRGELRIEFVEVEPVNQKKRRPVFPFLRTILVALVLTLCGSLPIIFADALTNQYRVVRASESGETRELLMSMELLAQPLTIEEEEVPLVAEIPTLSEPLTYDPALVSMHTRYEEDPILLEEWSADPTEGTMITLEELIKDEEVVEEIPSKARSIDNQADYKYLLTEEEREILTRVVEAEVTGTTYTYKGEHVSEEQMLISKIIVAQVYLNRVYDNDKFDHITTVKESVLEENATSTIKNGRYYKVEITDLSREAVELAVLSSTPDYSQGGLFFSSGTTTCAYGDYLFTDDVGHSVFK